MKEEEKKKAGSDEDGDQPPTPEAILAQQGEDGDIALVAEAAIRAFVAERLVDFYAEVESALDSFEGWALGQDASHHGVFSNAGFFNFIGENFIEQLHHHGGRSAPVMQAIAREASETISWAADSENDLGQFINYMRRGVRDACWFVRDSLPQVASTHWPHLLDLGYDGATDYMPALYHMGLPTPSFQGAGITHALRSHADQFRKAREARESKTEVSDEKKSEIDEATKAAQETSGKKQHAAVV